MRKREDKRMPDDATLIEMIKEHKTVRGVLKALGKTYHSSARILKLAKDNGLYVPSCVQGMSYGTYMERHQKLMDNKFHEMDSKFNINDSFKLKGHIWAINKINGTQKRKLYFCINEIGQPETFDAIDLKNAVIINKGE